MLQLFNALVLVIAVIWLPFRLFWGALKGVHKEWKDWVKAFIY